MRNRKKVTMVLAAVATAAGLAACGEGNGAGAPTAPYTIENKSCDRPFKCSYDVRIEDKLAEEELAAIANRIKADTPKVDNIFIVYYLPCMRIGNGGWATSRFTPELSVDIQEFMLEDNPACGERQ